MTQNVLEGLIGDIISRANFRPTLSQKDTSSSFSLGEKNHHVTTHRSVTLQFHRERNVRIEY